MMMLVRAAKLGDVPTILAIYNEEILHGVATFDTEEKTLTEREAWFNRLQPSHPVLVAEVDGRVLGFASAGAWSERKAYSGTAENSVYVEKNSRGKGLGKELLKALLIESKKSGLHTLIARITDGNQTSIELHKQLGFHHVGVLKEVGFKFGRQLDVTLMQRIL
jgi:L-amino acid N-acyltransferase YncA